MIKDSRDAIYKTHMDTEETKVEGTEEVVETPATDMPAEEATEAAESTEEATA